MTEPREHPARPVGEAVPGPTAARTETTTTSDGPVGAVQAAEVRPVDLRADVTGAGGAQAVDVQDAEVSPAAVAATADVRPHETAGAELPAQPPGAPPSALDDEQTVLLTAGPAAVDDEPTVLVTAAEPTGPPPPAEARPGDDPAPTVPEASLAAPQAAGSPAEESPGEPEVGPVDRPSGVAPGEEPPTARPAVAVPAVAAPKVVPAESGPVGAVPAAVVPAAAAAPATDVDDEPTRRDPAGADPVVAGPAAGEPASGEPSGAEAAVRTTGPASPVPSPDPDAAGLAPAGPVPDPSPGEAQPAADPARPTVAPWRRLSSAGALIWVLIALFGFTLVVQLRNNDTDQGLSTARQEDLVRILSDLEAREQRLAEEIRTLEASQRQLTSGVQGRQVALAEAEKRANELGLLAGTLPARGPGLLIDITPGDTPIKASAILNTVQELRGAGGEVMQLAGPDSTAVRVVASSSFVDAPDGVLVDGVRLRGPYRLTVIGDPQTMKTALNIPGGVVAAVGNAGGTVIPQERNEVEVTAVRRAGSLQYARPVS